LVILNNLQYTSAPKAFKNFGCVVLLSALGKVQGMAKELANNHGQSHQVFFAAPQPCERFLFFIRRGALYLNRYKKQARILYFATKN